jgi:hypothetical protein
MKRLILGLLVTALTGIYCVPANGWGQEGHRSIAKIAYDHVKCRTRKKLDKIIGERGMIYWANWADEIKSDNIYPQSIKDGWHYQDFEAGLSDSLVADALVHYRSEGGNLFRALDSLELEMAGEKVDPMNANHIMRFIIHLNGDRYCPVHIAHMDDKGGNTVKMKWFGRETNLHAVWDAKIIESQGYSYTEYAQMIQDEYGDMKREIEKKSDEQLLIDSYHMTESIYQYQQIWDGNTYHYIYTWRQPMERQLYIAGIRLAMWLNKNL